MIVLVLDNIERVVIDTATPYCVATYIIFVYGERGGGFDMIWIYL